MRREGVGAVAVVLVLCTSLSAQAQLAAVPATEHTVTISATGEAEADADWVEVNANIEAGGITADEAVVSSENARERAIADLVKEGFRAEDIRWTEPRIARSPYRWGTLPEQGPVQQFSAAATLTVRINVVERQTLYELICKAIDATSAARDTGPPGARMVSERYPDAGMVVFGVNDVKALQRKAIADAVRRVRELGAVAAEEVGKALGDVVAVSVQDLSTPPGYYASYENPTARQPGRAARYVMTTVTFKLQ